MDTHEKAFDLPTLVSKATRAVTQKRVMSKSEMLTLVERKIRHNNQCRLNNEADITQQKESIIHYVRDKDNDNALLGTQDLIVLEEKRKEIIKQIVKYKRIKYGLEKELEKNQQIQEDACLVAGLYECEVVSSDHVDEIKDELELATSDFMDAIGVELPVDFGQEFNAHYEDGEEGETHDRLRELIEEQSNKSDGLSKPTAAPVSVAQVRTSATQPRPPVSFVPSSGVAPPHVNPNAFPSVPRFSVDPTRPLPTYSSRDETTDSIMSRIRDS